MSSTKPGQLQLGINGKTIVKPASIPEEELLNSINKYDVNVDNLLVQLPLPK
jgi:methylenetetrahydrofolate dehydrogenase(NAD+)/5,10-methenyltetrahydrofolate cyclohydrolase